MAKWSRCSTRVHPGQTVAVAPGARAEPVPPVTLLLHKPAGFTVGDGQPSAWDLLTPERWQQGNTPAPAENVEQAFSNQSACSPSRFRASGLTVLTQDGRIRRKLTEEALFMEQECIAQVQGRIAPKEGLQRLCDGTAIAGKRLPRIKVSWQSRGAFALCPSKGFFPHEIEAMCAGAGWNWWV